MKTITIYCKDCGRTFEGAEAEVLEAGEFFNFGRCKVCQAKHDEKEKTRHYYG